jgi:O-antigen ligase
VAWFVAAFLSTSLFTHTVAVRLSLLGVGTALAAAAVARGRSGGRGDIRILPAIWLPFLLWGAWASLSLTWSVEPARTLKEVHNEIAYTAVALWMCFVGAQAENAARVLIPVAGVAAAVVMAIGVRDFSLGWEIYLTGLHGGPGAHSSALLVLMPCIALTGWYGWRAGWPWWKQLPVGALGGLALLGAYCTLNRTVWIGFAVEFLLIGGLATLRAQSPASWTTRMKLTGGIAALALVAGMAVMLGAVQAHREAVGGKSLAQDSRLALWPEIVERIGERPLTGYGFGRGLLRGPLESEFRQLDPFLWHAHNIFLEQLLQLGAPGLALFLLLLAVLLREAWRAARDADDMRAACGMALTAVVAGMLIRNMTDTLFVRQNALLFWGAVGTLLGLAARPRTRSTQGIAA